MAAASKTTKRKPQPEWLRSLDKKQYTYDEAKAERVIKFIESFCKHQEGELAGKPLLLTDWQKDDIIRPVFGIVHKKTGLRRYRTAYVEIPRKNGKSALSSAIGAYLLCGDQEPGAQVYAAAATKSQAGIVFNLSKKMIETSPRLSQSCEILKDSIFHKKSQSIFRVIPADADTLHGFNAHGVIIDELHVQPNRELYDVLSTSIGARRQPLVFIITTAGINQTFAEEIHDQAMNIKTGKIKDDTFFPVIYAADIKDDPFDEKTWEKANPGLDVIVKRDYLKMMAKRAASTPSFLNNFKRLHANIWTGATTAWVPDHEWQLCDFGKHTLDDMAGRDCWGGLDLASTRDLCSLSLYFPATQKDMAVFFTYFWCPADTIIERDRQENINYSTWVRDGYIFTVPGNSNDFRVIVDFILNLPLEINLKGIAYDAWNSNETVNTLIEEGCKMAATRQGHSSLSFPSKALEMMILKKELNHQGNPVMRWQMGNVVLKHLNDNIKPDKDRSKDKIDGIMSLVMAIGQHIKDTGIPSTKSRYENEAEDGLYSI